MRVDPEGLAVVCDGLVVLAFPITDHAARPIGSGKVGVDADGLSKASRALSQITLLVISDYPSEDNSYARFNSEKPPGAKAGVHAGLACSLEMDIADPRETFERVTAPEAGGQ